MNAKVWISIVAGVVLLTASMAPAENYFIRNRPFTQVIKVGSEPYVPLDGLLRALGYNWDMQDGKVMITKSGARNPTPTSSKVVLNYGGEDLALEGTPKGDTIYVPLRSVSKFLNYVVNVNRSSGIVDVVQGHMATDKEKAVAGEVAKSTEARDKAQKEAWEKKVAELKEKREEKSGGSGEAEATPTPGSEEVATASTDDKAKEDDKSSKSKSKSKDKTVEAAPSPTPDTTSKDKAAEVPKVQRLEIFSSDATPDYSVGRIKVTATIKNNGDAPAPNVSGTLTLTEPVTTPGKTARVLVKKSIRGPGLAPDKSWDYTETFNHNLGTSMPHGAYTVDIQLYNPPPPKAKP